MGPKLSGLLADRCQSWSQSQSQSQSRPLATVHVLARKISLSESKKVLTADFCLTLTCLPLSLSDATVPKAHLFQSHLKQDRNRRLSYRCGFPT